MYPDLLCHTANSAATLRGPRAHFDMVRTGIAMYGLAPSNDDPFKDDLRPAMKLSSYVAGVREVVPGDSVGLRTARSSPRSSRASASCPIGYADGVRRALDQPRRGAGRRPALPHRRHDQHGPADGAAARRLGRGRATRSCFFGAAGDGVAGGSTVAWTAPDGPRLDAPRRRASSARRWRGCSAPSTTRSPATWRRGWCAATAATAPRPDVTVAAPATRNAPPSPDEVTRAARAALGPGEAGWLVGGCLRDELLGRRVRDVDIVVDGTRRAARARPRRPPRRRRLRHLRPLRHLARRRRRSAHRRRRPARRAAPDAPPDAATRAPSA